MKLVMPENGVQAAGLAAHARAEGEAAAAGE